MATDAGGDETGNETGGPWDYTGDKTAAMAGDERDGGGRCGKCMRMKVRIQSMSAIFLWLALRNFAMVDFEENAEEMVWTTREAADGDRVGWGLYGNETGNETGGPSGPGDETADKTAATAGDERDGGDRWGNVYG